MAPKFEPVRTREDGIDARAQAKRRAPKGRFAAAARSADSTRERLGLLAQQWHENHAEIARAHARQAKILSDVADLALTQHPNDPELALRSFAAELAAASRSSDRSVLRQMNEAHDLIKEFPKAHEALAAGKLSAAHTRVIVSEGTQLPSELREAYVEAVLPAAFQMTSGRLRSRAARIAGSLQPMSIEERHRVAAEQRRVWIRDLPDGMAELHAEISAVLAYGIFDRLTRAGRLAKQQAASAVNANLSAEAHVTGANSKEETADSRTLDQLRADALCELLLTADARSTTPSTRTVVGIVPSITLRVAATRAGAEQIGSSDQAGDSEQTRNFEQAGNSEQPRNSDGAGHSGHSPAEMVGYGPIDPATARQLLAAAPGWNRVAVDINTDSDSFRLAVATDRYRPSEHVRRILEARDEHCRFPGCRMPLAYCEIDHTQEWVNGGKTTVSNLAHLCRSHHALKHPEIATGLRWRVTQHSGGVLEWESPAGKKHFDSPDAQEAEPP